MKFKQLLKLTILTVCVGFLTTSFAGEITYNLYTGNEHQISPTVFEFDVYIQATGTEGFKLRSVQNSYTFNPAFINGATVNVNYIPGSSQIPSFDSQLKWSNTANGFTSTSNKAGTCSSNGVMVPIQPGKVKVATYRLTAVAGSFGSAPAKVSFVKPGEADPASDLRLKTAVSRWDDVNCVKGSASNVKFKDASQSTKVNEVASSTMSPSLFPNPTAGKTTISFNAPKADNYMVKVYDALGHVVMTSSIPSAVGFNSKEIDLQGQAAGRYTISIQSNDSDKESLQLVKE